MTQLLHIMIPIELNNGNTGRGHKWFRSSKLRSQYEEQLRDLPRPNFTVPTRNVVTRVLGKGQRLWDSSSVGRGNWKEIEDALVALGWWPDDSPKYIVQTDFRQDATQRSHGPFTLLEVYEAAAEVGS